MSPVTHTKEILLLRGCSLLEAETLQTIATLGEDGVWRTPEGAVTDSIGLPHQAASAIVKGGALLQPDQQTDLLDPLDRLADPIERGVIEAALDFMVMKGLIEEHDADLIGDLQDLYAANPSLHREIHLTGDVLHDAARQRPGSELAAVYEQEQQDRWEREQAERWACACGFTFGLYPWSNSIVNFYTLTDDGLFNAQVDKCPRCDRDLAKLRAERPSQLGFVF